MEEQMIAIGFLGAGNMAEAIIGGIIRKKLYSPSGIAAYDINSQRMVHMESRFGLIISASPHDLAKASRAVVIAMKPSQVLPAIKTIRNELEGKLIITIAAGISIAAIQSVLGESARVVRVMPNTPALVLEGASAIAGSSTCTHEDLGIARDIFSGIGICVELNESQIDAVTGLSGSGPAYCFALIEAMADGGVRAGLPRDIAIKLAAATLKGSGAMVLETGKHPAELRDMVTSPSGTTAEGLAILENRGFRAAVSDAVWFAYKRSIELSSKA
jgi:pyrroline-5-carboxylate reductase